jgi:light-regulated signal transduction histidine kinase (bacteriophytochrome)
MGQLIDDLLDFSRLGRKEMMRTHIDMDELVHAIANEVKENNNNQPIIIKINSLEDAKGDENMIRQVWTNLISNAVKYSSKNEKPEIEIGSTEKEGNVCYHVRDNGVGFDMQYVSKLFGVFQRLHKVNDFDGTGVGLALVKTIVERHGGKVWGEGKVDLGATFYFTLPTIK